VTAPQPEPVNDVPPYRVVDRYGRGWYFTSAGTYDADYGWRDDLREWTLNEIRERREGWRPVLPPDPAEVSAMRAHLAEAGTRAAASLLVAVHAVARTALDTTASSDLLIAGRCGSWESAYLAEVAFTHGSQLAADDRDRYVEDVAAFLTGVLMHWVFAPDRYTEVAENLAAIFGSAADQMGGWDAVSEGTLRLDDALERYLMSTSRSYWEGKLR
jgi:hypothetical protein